MAERPQRSGGCGFEARQNHCASTSPVPTRFTIFPTGTGAMAARRAPLSQPQTRQRAPTLKIRHGMPTIFNPTHVNVTHAGRLFIAFPAGVGAMAVEAETLTRRPRCRQRACEGPHRSKPYWCDAGLFSLRAPPSSSRPYRQSPACEQESGQAAQDATRRRYAGRPEDFHYNKGLDGKISIQPFELPAVCYLAWRAIMS